MSLFERLPNELFALILSFLPPAQIVRCKAISKTWKSSIESIATAEWACTNMVRIHAPPKEPGGHEDFVVWAEKEHRFTTGKPRWLVLPQLAEGRNQNGIKIRLCGMTDKHVFFFADLPRYIDADSLWVNPHVSPNIRNRSRLNIWKLPGKNNEPPEPVWTPGPDDLPICMTNTTELLAHDDTCIVLSGWNRHFRKWMIICLDFIDKRIRWCRGTTPFAGSDSREALEGLMFDSMNDRSRHIRNHKYAYVNLQESLQDDDVDDLDSEDDLDEEVLFRHDFIYTVLDTTTSEFELSEVLEDDNYTVQCADDFRSEVTMDPINGAWFARLVLKDDSCLQVELRSTDNPRKILTRLDLPDFGEQRMDKTQFVQMSYVASHELPCSHPKSKRLARLVVGSGLQDSVEHKDEIPKLKGFKLIFKEWHIDVIPRSVGDAIEYELRPAKALYFDESDYELLVYPHVIEAELETHLVYRKEKTPGEPDENARGFLDAYRFERIKDKGGVVHGWPGVQFSCYKPSKNALYTLDWDKMLKGPDLKVINLSGEAVPKNFTDLSRYGTYDIATAEGLLFF